MTLRTSPPSSPNFKISFPSPRILVLTLTRTSKLNCIDLPTSALIAKVWEEFDKDASLWIAIITGEGRAFCTGADLGEWNNLNKTGTTNSMDAPGLAGLPRRSGKKPIIAAVNGLCMGGGFEMIANCDLIVSASSAVYALPEVKRGIVPVAGCLPRLVSILGMQRTMELVLTGRKVDAKTLERWGLINRLVDDVKDVLPAALSLAEEICENSPDAVIVGRMGLRMAWEEGKVEDAVERLAQGGYMDLVKSENFKEGIQAFVEKRAAVWRDSKL